MEAEKANRSIVSMARALGVSRSGFYDWRNRGATQDGQRACRIEAVKALHEDKRASLGSRGRVLRLQRQGYPVGRYRARSPMRKAGVVCRQRRRFRATTHVDRRRPVAPNRPARQFDVTTPNRVRCADIAAIWTLGGWLYLAAVLDLGDRRIVGWALANHRRTERASNALTMALGRRRSGPGLLHRSDRGSQYSAIAYRALLKDRGILPSTSRKSDCWDNAVMARFFGTLKSERTGNQRYSNRAEAERDAIRFIEMEYNSDRDHSANDYRTPREQTMVAAA